MAQEARVVVAVHLIIQINPAVDHHAQNDLEVTAVAQLTLITQVVLEVIAQVNQAVIEVVLEVIAADHQLVAQEVEVRVEKAQDRAQIKVFFIAI